MLKTRARGDSIKKPSKFGLNEQIVKVETLICMHRFTDKNVLVYADPECGLFYRISLNIICRLHRVKPIIYCLSLYYDSSSCTN